MTEQLLQRLEAAMDQPVTRTLSLLIRPSFVAAPGKTLVWGDWSAIEARTLPWLAGTKKAAKVLEIFDGNDNDPGKPDIYMIEACNLSGDDPQVMWDRYRDKDPHAKQMRQGGKVAVLSLGFGGSHGALEAMAANYGISYTHAERQRVIDGWRGSNTWARRLWDDLWEAVQDCMRDPGTICTAGRVAYMYDPDYLSGTVICALPNGQRLTYPRIKWRTVEKENPYTGEVEEKEVLTYKRGFGWSGLWYGKLAENITQAAAGALLREKLVELRPEKTVVGHTHDEIVTEVDEDDGERYADHLEKVMRTQPEWLEGCPLAVETSVNWYYTKAID